MIQTTSGLFPSFLRYSVRPCAARAEEVVTKLAFVRNKGARHQPTQSFSSSLLRDGLGRDRHSNFTESPVSPTLGAGVCSDEHQFSIRSNQARLNSHDYTRPCQHHHRYSGLLWLGGRVCQIASSPPMQTGVLYCLKLSCSSPLTSCRVTRPLSDAPNRSVFRGSPSQ